MFDESADTVINEVRPPHDHWCSSMHQAPEMFKRDPDVKASEEPTRFFHVKSSAPNGKLDGIYCEPCLIVANHLARIKKKRRELFK